MSGFLFGLSAFMVMFGAVFFVMAITPPRSDGLASFSVFVGIIGVMLFIATAIGRAMS